MAGDDLCLGGIQAQEFTGVEVDELMACSVESILADLILFIILARNRVEVGFGSHCLVEGRVEYGDVGHAWENCFAGLDAAQVGGVVERSENETVSDAFLDGFANDDRSRVLGAAVEDAMPDRLDFRKRLEDTDLGGDQLVANRLERFAVVLDGQGFLEFLVAWLVDQMRGFQTDSLHKSLCDDCFASHVKQGEFQGRTAGVDDQNFHEYSPIGL